MSLSVRRTAGRIERYRMLTIYESSEPTAEKILVQGEFGITSQDETLSGTHFKRVLVDMLKVMALLYAPCTLLINPFFSFCRKQMPKW